jgi:hypothetical protein
MELVKDSRPSVARAFGLLAFAMVLLTGCQGPKYQATSTFYDRNIGPILKQSCADSPTQSGCHVAQNDRGNAFGNLNVTSYDTLIKRHDLLVTYGPYDLPALIVKALKPFQVRLTTWDSADPTIITTDIPHAGGTLLDVTSTSYLQLLQWIERGATENDALLPPVDLGRTPCSDVLGTDPEFDPTADPTTPDYPLFVGTTALPGNGVNGVLAQNCAAGNCHGSPANELYLTCGTTPEEARWNYFVAGDYVSVDPAASEILRRPLATAAGGVYHEGGGVFMSLTDPGYLAIQNWAKVKGGPTDVPTDPGFLFFAHRVQPMLVKKGCMLLGCHSPAMGHDYRLRAGSGGNFGLPTTRRNYDLTINQIALESPDPNVSRIIRKNVAPPIADSPVPQTAHGILHRGNSLFGQIRDDCDDDAAANGDLDSQDPYCVIIHWIKLESAARMANRAPFSGIVYVKRTAAPGPDGPQDYETYASGADLMKAPATLAPDGTLSVQPGSSLLGACGLTAGIDVRRPAVSWDGTQIAFSARTSATVPWKVYLVDAAGGCAVEPHIDAAPVDDGGNAIPDNGELIHNFDPAFAPDGRIVFASTRGNVMNAGIFDYQGPQRTPADPSKLNANLYVVDADGSIRQLTFLLNQEMTPSFMSDGRLTMTTEKRANGFYQLSGRRENLDGGDYHPLFGQRATIGYHQVTDIVELTDKDFAAIFSDPGAQHGGGVLGVVNRSLGPDQHSENADDYTQDPSAKDWPDPKFYQHSVRFLDGTGTPGQGGGVYRNPTPLPNGSILVSYAADVGDVGNFSGNFDLVVVDPINGTRSAPVVSSADDEVWPVAIYARPDRGVFVSKLDEPNGATRVSTDPGDKPRADVTILDLPLLASLMFQNTRSQRIITEPPAALQVWEDLPPDTGVTSYDGGGDFVVSDTFGKVYVRRRLLGALAPFGDGSAHLTVPGGAAIVLEPIVKLAKDKQPTQHQQLEEMQFYPGEFVRQGFQQHLFNGICAGCHGAVSGRDEDISVNPDILTQASRVAVYGKGPTSLTSTAGAPQKPPFP